MKQIPTAEEQLKASVDSHKYGSDVEECMIEFAQMHVQAALQKVVNKIDVEDVINGDNSSILNAYPESNIK